jgi:hypothetical protein
MRSQFVCSGKEIAEILLRPRPGGRENGRPGFEDRIQRRLVRVEEQQVQSKRPVRPLPDLPRGPVADPMGPSRIGCSMPKRGQMRVRSTKRTYFGSSVTVKGLWPGVLSSPEDGT